MIKQNNLLAFAIFTLLGINSIYSQKSSHLYRRHFDEGNKLFLEKNYTGAVNEFFEAYKIDSSSANIKYCLGRAYLYSPNQKEKAIDLLDRASKNTTGRYSEFDAKETRAPFMVNYYLGEAYQINYKFEQAISKYNFTAELYKMDKEMPKDLRFRIQQCQKGIELMKNPDKEVKIETMGPTFNTPYAEYCPVINADESMIIFTSRRPGGYSEEKAPDGQMFEDIYVSYKISEGSGWSSPKLISRYINTEENDAAVGLSPDGKELFIFKNDNGGDLYNSLSSDGGNWSVPLPLESDINSPSWETHATISSDGQTLYFVSNRPGGLGGRDIYRCVKLPNGRWSLATNMGAPINTEYDEDAPFIHPDGVTLLFSSNGPNSMGGFDIFYSTRTEEQSKKKTTVKWSEPKNVGVPINTTGDDIYYVLSTDGRRAYYSSEQKGGTGDKDLYIINLPSSVANPVALMVGNLTFDGNVKDIPKGVRITVRDEETGTLVQDLKPNPKTGKYIMILAAGNAGKTYDVKYEAEGFETMTEKIKIEAGSSYQELKREVRLKLMNFETKKEGTIALSGIVRDADKKIIPTVKLIIKDNLSGAVIKSYNTLNDSGSYYVNVESGKNYNLSFESDGYLFHSENVDVPAKADFTEIKRNIIMDKIVVGSSIVLKNIFFETGKAKITKASKSELDELYDLLTKNFTLEVEISGHTDNKGNEDANVRLSQARAQAVVDFLVKNQKLYYVAPFYKKGVDKNRLKAVGYGSSKPMGDNSTQAGMQQNRRVELKITGNSATVVEPTKVEPPKAK